MNSPPVVWVAVEPLCRCIVAFHDPATLTPQDSLALRLRYSAAGLAVSLAPAHNAITRFCGHTQTAPQQDLFTGVAP